MTREEIANKPASEKTYREELIGQALAVTISHAILVLSTNWQNIAANRAISAADAVIERLAAEEVEK